MSQAEKVGIAEEYCSPHDIRDNAQRAIGIIKVIEQLIQVLDEQTAPHRENRDLVSGIYTAIHYLFNAIREQLVSIQTTADELIKSASRKGEIRENA